MGGHVEKLRGGVALGSVLLAMLATGAQAQQSTALSAGAANAAADTPVVLDQITVQGEGQPGGALLNGPTTTRATRQDLDREQVQSLSELSNRVEAGIAFNRQNNSLNIRGLDGPRVLTTIDGIRQPYLVDARISKSSTNAFDFDSLSTLDLLRGPSGSSTLGSGALGGALAVRTLDPEDLIRNGRSYGALAKTGYDSTDRAWFGSAATAARLNDTWFLLQGGYRDGHEVGNNGNIKSFGATRTASNPADFNQYNLLAKVHHYVDGVHRFGITGELFKRDDRIRNLDSTVSLTGNYRPSFYRSGEDVARKRLSLTYDYKLPGSFIDEAHASLYWQNVTRNQLIWARRFTSNPLGLYTRNGELDQDSYGFEGYAIKSFQTGIASHRVTAGADLGATKLKQYTSGIDGCPSGPPYPTGFSGCNNLHTNQSDQPDVDGRRVGLYLHDEIGFIENRLRITPGARFDWYEEKPQSTPAYTKSSSYPGALPASSSDSAWSPRLRAEYDILKNAPYIKDLTFFAQWAKTFRAPTAQELYGRFGAVGTYLSTGNPNLRPEVGNGVDVGLRFGDKALGGSVTYFHTDYHNFIDTYQVAAAGGLYPQGGITGYRNISRAEIQGVEVSGQYAFAPNWLLRGSFAYTRGINKTDNTFLNSVAPMQGIIAVAYGTDRWGAEVSTKLAGPRDDVAVSGTGVGFKAPGYTLFNASAWWRPAPQIADVELQLGVYNIFDRKYYDAVNVPLSRPMPRDYYTEPGRTVKATLKYQF